MKKFYINKKNNLCGEVKISGSKNSILSILSASLLSNYDILIKNVPNISDVKNKIKILKKLGSKIFFFNSNCYINNSLVDKFCIPLKLSKLVRTSILILSPILVRFGIAKSYFPGGCNFCDRPIDLHIKIFNDFGIKTKLKNNKIKIFLFKKFINGSKIFINKISVGATITAILLSVLANGITIIRNISVEPEILDMINFLNIIGANINIKNNKIIVIGVKKLFGGTYTIISDRIETGTFLLAATISMGKIYCLNTNYKFLKNVIKILKISGANIKCKNDYIYIEMKNYPKPVSFFTDSYPGFPTDLQPIFINLNIISKNNIYSIITENIFNYRFSHVNEFLKIGANIKFLSNNKIICIGVKNTFGSYLYPKDLRSSISLLLSGIRSEGQTVIIDNFNYIDRGYENILNKLRFIGVNIIESDI